MNLPSRFFSWEIFDTIITDYEFIFFDFFDLYNSFLFICFDVLLFPPYVEKTLIPVFLFFFFFGCTSCTTDWTRGDYPACSFVLCLNYLHC